MTGVPLTSAFGLEMAPVPWTQGATPGLISPNLVKLCQYTRIPVDNCQESWYIIVSKDWGD